MTGIEHDGRHIVLWTWLVTLISCLSPSSSKREYYVLDPFIFYHNPYMKFPFSTLVKCYSQNCHRHQKAKWVFDSFYIKTVTLYYVKNLRVSITVSLLQRGVNHDLGNVEKLLIHTVTFNHGVLWAIRRSFLRLHGTYFCPVMYGVAAAIKPTNV